MGRLNNRASRQVSITNTTETDIAVASTLGFAHDIYGLVLTNTSATATTVTLYDGGLASGTKKFVWAVPAGETRGFMVDAEYAVKAAASNTAWTAICGTGVTTMEITALYTRRPIRVS